ncbi:hypothetical protein ESZ36_17150 [Colwellia demingiae]|uniref:Uncharacterized protein n=1 Tax=Colwellia demingiae TaxID=89401 RepID=A0A5C6Q9V8_9GAMM|nr:hypothetical protein [Colwellia demingiae]TWX65533.1 hypothetical protein ESZ36_17150 [Colwellia demingiae]
MEPIKIKIKNHIDTRSLSFELTLQIQTYFENRLDGFDKPDSNFECLILFPDNIKERGALLSLVTLIRIDNQQWEILNIAVYEIIEEGKTTKFLGRVHGQYAELDVMDDSVNRQELIKHWQQFIVDEIKNSNNLTTFTEFHLMVLRSTGHEVISDFEEQKPELCVV